MSSGRTAAREAGAAAAAKGTVAYLAERGGGPGVAFKAFIDALYDEAALDPKTRELIFLAVQTALDLEPSVRAHLPRAVKAGATRAEIIAAMMLSVPNAGVAGALRCVALVEEMIDA